MKKTIEVSQTFLKYFYVHYYCSPSKILKLFLKFLLKFVHSFPLFHFQNVPGVNHATVFQFNLVT